MFAVSRSISSVFGPFDGLDRELMLQVGLVRGLQTSFTNWKSSAHHEDFKCKFCLMHENFSLLTQKSIPTQYERFIPEVSPNQSIFFLFFPPRLFRVITFRRNNTKPERSHYSLHACKHSQCCQLQYIQCWSRQCMMRPGQKCQSQQSIRFIFWGD